MTPNDISRIVEAIAEAMNRYAWIDIGVIDGEWECLYIRNGSPVPAGPIGIKVPLEDPPLASFSGNEDEILESLYEAISLQVLPVIYGACGRIEISFSTAKRGIIADFP